MPRTFPQSVAITETTYRTGSDWLVDHMHQYVGRALGALKQAHLINPEAPWNTTKTQKGHDEWSSFDTGFDYTLYSYGLLPKSAPTLSVPVSELDDFGNNLNVTPVPMKGVTTPVRMLMAMLHDLGFLDTNETDEWHLEAFRTYRDPTMYKGVHNSIAALRTMMKKAGKSRLFLPGRDAWPWAVMAAARGIPFTYVPCISRKVASDPGFKDFLLNTFGKEYLQGCFGFDTGFEGSIFRTMETVLDTKLTWVLFSANQHIWAASEQGRYRVHNRLTKTPTMQVFPTMKGSRHAALEMEYLPKYLKTGKCIEDGKPVQYLASPGDTIRAALLTCEMFYGGAKLKPLAEPKPMSPLAWFKPLRNNLERVAVLDPLRGA